jgi:hypothetical protein
MFAGNMVTVVYVTAAEFEAAKAAPAAGGGDAAGDAAAAEDAAAGVAAVGLVTHGSPSPDRGEGADKVRREGGVLAALRLVSGSFLLQDVAALAIVLVADMLSCADLYAATTAGHTGAAG